MKMTGAQAVAAQLVAHGVDAVFGVPGGHNLPLFAALEQIGIATIGARHEQGAGLMAEAWFRVAGRTAVVVTTAGPGLTNTLTPIAHAAADGASVCVLALDNYLHTLADSSGQFHGISDMGTAVSAFADLVGCATTPAAASEIVAQALDQMAPRRARPVVVQLPSDVLTKSGEVGAVGAALGHDLSPDPGAVSDLVNRLAAAQSPVIFAGAGAVRSGAHDELMRLAERLGCPVVTTVSGRGAIPDDHPLATGPIWDRFGPQDGVAERADLVLCVGTRLTPLATRNGMLPIGGRVSCIDLEPEFPARLYPPAVALRGDARQALLRVLDDPALPDRGEPSHFADEVRTAADEWRASFAKGAPKASELLEALAAATPRNTVFCCDMTVLGYWAQRFLPVYRPGGLISPYYFGTLGYGLPAAIGAQIADPKAAVVALCGDAGFVMNSQEMATARHLNLPVRAVVINDGGYAAVHADERRTGVGALSISKITNPRFDLLAAAYGWHHQRVGADGSQVTAALRLAADTGGPSLIEVVLDVPLPMPYEVRW
jgi:acetolactate synthase I/II/III large subunit